MKRLRKLIDFKAFRPDIMDPSFSLKDRVPSESVALISLSETVAKIAKWNAKNGISDIQKLESFDDKELFSKCRELAPSGMLCISMADPIRILVKSVASDSCVKFGHSNFLHAEFAPNAIESLESRFREFKILRIFPEPLALLCAIQQSHSAENITLATHNTVIMARFNQDGSCKGASIFDPAHLPSSCAGLVYKSDTFAQTLDVESSNELSNNLDLEVLCA